MAGPGVCDGCGERPVMFMVTQVDTGDTNGWCPFCFITSAEELGRLLIAEGVIPAPEEPGPKSGRRKSEPAPDQATAGGVDGDSYGTPINGAGSPDQAEATEPAAALDG